MNMQYYLATQPKTNNYFPIHLTDLDIYQKEETTSLERIDAFTSQYTKKELLTFVKNANINEVNDDTDLVIIYYEKEQIRHIPILTKDIEFDFWSFLSNHYENKVFLNKVENFLKNKISLEEYLSLKNNHTKEEYLKKINDFNYEIKRKLYFYLYENCYR